MRHVTWLSDGHSGCEETSHGATSRPSCQLVDGLLIPRHVLYRGDIRAMFCVWYVRRMSSMSTPKHVGH